MYRLNMLTGGCCFSIAILTYLLADGAIASDTNDGHVMYTMRNDSKKLHDETYGFSGATTI